MNMLKEAILLWKQERSLKETPLQRRLFAFFACMAAFLILTFVALLLLFDINGRGTQAVEHLLSTELSYLSTAMDSDFGRMSVQGISFSETLAQNADAFFTKEGIQAAEFQNYPDLTDDLLSEQISIMKNMVENNSCSGVFVILDATVNPSLENAEYSRAGIFLKKTQPNAVDSMHPELHYLRGPANIARENGMELLGQWKMEFNVKEQSFFNTVTETARSNPDLPLSRLYYWTDRIALEGNSESAFLLCIPLISQDGTVFGICGIEVSDRLFKQMYSPSSEFYPNIFVASAPIETSVFHIENGMIAGNYYLTSTRMENAFEINCSSEGFCTYQEENASFGGLHTGLTLYPKDSAYEDQKWAVAVLMPMATLENALKGNSRYLLIIVLSLLTASLVASIFISRRYLRPVTEALDRIKSKNYDTASNTPYLEINDLMEFLAQQDEEDKRRRKSYGDTFQMSAPMFEEFLKNVKTLSLAETAVFELYMKGHKAQEIADELHLSINTIKTHNRRIFAKLNVSSRKELLVYINMMKELDIISQK